MLYFSFLFLAESWYIVWVDRGVPNYSPPWLMSESSFLSFILERSTLNNISSNLSHPWLLRYTSSSMNNISSNLLYSVTARVVRGDPDYPPPRLISESSFLSLILERSTLMTMVLAKTLWFLIICKFTESFN